MKQAAKYIFAGFLGAFAWCAIVASSETLSRQVSQRLYDCGIHVADNVSGVTISGATIKGHQHGICVDDPHGDHVTVTGNFVDMKISK